MSAELQLPVDWDAAAVVGKYLSKPGPTATRTELDDYVARLRIAAQESVPHVLDVTQMLPADGRDLNTEPLSLVHIVDRPHWIAANTQVMRTMLTPQHTTATPSTPTTPATPTTPPVPEGTARALTHADAISHLVGGAQVGAALALISSKVLGQLDPYASQSPATGRLLLVAPNILAVQRSLNLDADDFQLWVCLHEQTHALQFAAAPWLAAHMMLRTQTLLQDLSSRSKGLSVGGLAQRGKAAATGLRNFVHGGRSVPLVDRFLTPLQRAEMADVGAVMALLEGHADVVMDDVGPRVVPTVRKIRRAFDHRRQDVRARDFVVRKLLGMDAKMAQYRDGAKFVRAVLDDGGWELFNRVWTGPHTLPTAAEIAHPRAWVQRVDSSVQCP